MILSFVVNLEKAGGIAFHLNPRWGEEGVVRNSCLSG